MELPSVDDLTRHRTLWNATSAAAAVLAAMAIRKGIQAGWERVRGEPPPMNPASPLTGWGDALAWTATLGLAAGLGRLVARRGAAAGWRHVTGRMPPGLR